jgi:mannose-6-phosphate isomerase-like protein (cupin superfamily)
MAKAPVTSITLSPDEMSQYISRFKELRLTSDFDDAGIPGYERKTYRVIGDQDKAPIQAVDFHLNLIVCGPGKGAPLHSHLTQEVFISVTGCWEIFWGPEGTESIVLEPLDTIAIPPRIPRGFKNISQEEGTLIGIVGGSDPGQIDWPENVKAIAQAAGIKLI